MKQAITGGISGYVSWIVSIGPIMSCELSVFFVIGSLASFSEFAIKTTANIIYPDGITPESYSYETTTTDEFANREPPSL